MKSKLVIILICVILLLVIGLTIFFVLKLKKKNMLKKINDLDILKNEIMSLPIQNEIEKALEFAKGEQLGEKIHNYQESIFTIYISR